MNLRDKETGEVKFVEYIELRGVCPVNFGNYKFNSIAELNEKFEDYKPVEPLIKDEKIRKAVRAWAEANGVEQVTVEKDFSSYTFFATDTGKVDITVWTEPSLSNLAKDKTYTIIELCGEEEDADTAR